ncbi:hypothetical protein CLD22_02440 [Rubrivivax gelatinosus]|nr:hypothetical protein [Rubrivivax gelatinosus]
MAQRLLILCLALLVAWTGVATQGDFGAAGSGETAVAALLSDAAGQDGNLIDEHYLDDAPAQPVGGGDLPLHEAMLPSAPAFVAATPTRAPLASPLDAAHPDAVPAARLRPPQQG